MSSFSFPVFFNTELVASKKPILAFSHIEMLVKEERVKSFDLHQTKKTATRPLLSTLHLSSKDPISTVLLVKPILLRDVRVPGAASPHPQL